MRNKNAQSNVCSCAPIFKFSYGPQDFPLEANLYQKLSILAILWPVSLQFESRNGEIWREGADLGSTLPRSKFR